MCIGFDFEPNSAAMTAALVGHGFLISAYQGELPADGVRLQSLQQLAMHSNVASIDAA